MVWDNRKLTVFFLGFIIVAALLMVTVVQSAIISRQVNKEYKRIRRIWIWVRYFIRIGIRNFGAAQCIKHIINRGGFYSTS